MYTSLSLPKIKKTCELLKNASISYIEKSIPLYAIEADDYKNCNIPPKGEYLPFESVDGKDKRFWIRAEFKTPRFERNSDIFVEVKTGVTGWDGLNPQAIFYANGKIYVCGNCVDIQSPFTSDTPLDAVRFDIPEFDRKCCYKESVLKR